jgi:hypothetical protein
MQASVGIVSVDRCPHFGQVSSHVVIIAAPMLPSAPPAVPISSGGSSFATRTDPAVRSAVAQATAALQKALYH